MCLEASSCAHMFLRLPAVVRDDETIGRTLLACVRSRDETLSRVSKTMDGVLDHVVEGTR